MVSTLNSSPYRENSTALNTRFTWPTVILAPRLAMIRPRASSPPPQQPQVRTKPVPTPEMTPPSRQPVSRSATRGSAGTGTILVNRA